MKKKLIAWIAVLSVMLVLAISALIYFGGNKRPADFENEPIDSGNGTASTEGTSQSTGLETENTDAALPSITFETEGEDENLTPEITFPPEEQGASQNNESADGNNESDGSGESEAYEDTTPILEF